MARSVKIIKKRIIQPDPLYGNKTLARFINRLMHSGKKSAAQTQVYKALDILRSSGVDPLKTFETALHMIGPRLEVRARRVGGASYQVPTEVKGDRRVSLSIRWIIAAAKRRSNREYHSFSDKLAAEISDILKNQGDAIKKRDTVHRMAEANRAFAHFRW